MSDQPLPSNLQPVAPRPVQDPLMGLACPNCGGIISIPEGQNIVCCPYCDRRSFVRGERGVRRFQLAQRIGRDQAIQSMRQFLSRHWAIARDASRRAQLTEAFLAYLPFWTVWGRAMGWAFGQVKRGSGKHSHYEPREVKIVEDLLWDGPACEVGEFGVGNVPIDTKTLQPFNPEALHAAGLVFEPVNSFSDARAQAEATFKERMRGRARLDRLAQLFIRFFRTRYGLVYYPLWVLRYLYRGRAYQVVVDGCTGKVLYGKAPGNTIYRVAVLVAGMAVGAIIAVDGTALALYLSRDSHSGDNILILALAALVIGFGMMGAAYRAFRYGEQFEQRNDSLPVAKNILPADAMLNLETVEKWLNQLS